LQCKALFNLYMNHVFWYCQYAIDIVFVCICHDLFNDGLPLYGV
jgi:hypothetical protein